LQSGSERETPLRNQAGGLTMGSVASDFLLETQSWDRETQRDRTARRGIKPFALTLTVIISLIIFTLFFVWSRLWVINLGYRISETLKEQEELIEVNRKLKIERAIYVSPEKIRSDAKKRLGMREPQENQIRYIK
jgi:cell division protein FtsL